jgi:hypothetical protein
MKKLTFKNIGITFLIIILAIQFVPTEKNSGNTFGPNHISTIIPITENINQILVTSCYDCHSNHTEYPWYNNLQPIAFWLNHHIDEGKDELNFSEFATYTKKRQLHKLDEIVEMVETHEMPLSSYTLVHTNAKLTNEQQKLLIEWAKQSTVQLKKDNDI